MRAVLGTASMMMLSASVIDYAFKSHKDSESTRWATAQPTLVPDSSFSRAEPEPRTSLGAPQEYRLHRTALSNLPNPVGEKLPCNVKMSGDPEICRKDNSAAGRREGWYCVCKSRCCVRYTQDRAGRDLPDYPKRSPRANPCMQLDHCRIRSDEAESSVLRPQHRRCTYCIMSHVLLPFTA